MNSPRLFLAASLLLAAPAFALTPTIPERHPADRYQELSDSPFSLATPTAPVAEPVKGWASNFYVGGIGRDYVNGKEEVMVGVKERGGQIAFTLFGSEPGYEGIAVSGVKWLNERGKSEVTLKKGTEFATIKFDEQLVQTPAAPPVPPAGQRPAGNPALPNQGRNLVRPAGAGAAAAAVPRPTNVPGALPQALPGAVPLPSNTNSSNTNARANAVPAQPEVKHRVRVIKSTP